MPAARSFSAEPPRSGILLMVIAMFLIPLGDTLTKILATGISPFELAFWRFLGQMALLALTLLVLRRSFRPGNLVLLALGGLTMAATLSALVGAFAVMPIATAIAIFFVEPLLLTVLSAWILKEPTGWRRFAAVGVGLVGAVIVIRPNFATFGINALFPLVAALSFAFHAIILRRVSANMTALAVQFWVALFGALFLGLGVGLTVVLGVSDLMAPVMDSTQWSLIACAAVLSTITFLMVSEAFKRTPAATLAPFQYLEIIGGVVLGYLVFGDVPDLLTILGTSIILGAGLYIIQRERKAGQTIEEPGQVRE